MRVRGLLIGTAILSAALGAIVAYLILTVPNDLEAGHLLREARAEIKAAQNEKARDSLARIIQQYPRTDAAAAATVALIELQHEELVALEREIDQLRHDRDRQTAALGAVQGAVTKLASMPPPAPPAVEKKPAPQKVQPKKRSNRRRR